MNTPVKDPSKKTERRTVEGNQDVIRGKSRSGILLCALIAPAGWQSCWRVGLRSHAACEEVLGVERDAIP